MGCAASHRYSDTSDEESAYSINEREPLHGPRGRPRSNLTKNVRVRVGPPTVITPGVKAAHSKDVKDVKLEDLRSESRKPPVQSRYRQPRSYTTTTDGMNDNATTRKAVSGKRFEKPLYVRMPPRRCS